MIQFKSNPRITFSIFLFILIIQPVFSQTETYPEALVDWVKDNVYSIKSTDPDTYKKDLLFLNKVIDDEKLILLGEGTHGTKEFFEIKDKIVRYLLTQKKFSKLGIEYDLVKGTKVNEYIHGAELDLYEALNEQRGWVWNTEEIANMIKWMRTYAAKGGKIEYSGIDVFRLIESANEAVIFLEKNKVEDIDLVTTHWSGLFENDIAHFVTNRNEFYKRLEAQSLSTYYELVELMQLLVDLYDQHKSELLNTNAKRVWLKKRQLAKTALNRSKHILQFNLNYIFSWDDWETENQLYRSFGNKVDSLNTLLAATADQDLLNDLSPILEAIKNPYKGRKYYLTELNFQERSDWKDQVQYAIQRIKIRKPLFLARMNEKEIDRLQVLLIDVITLFESFNGYFDKSLKRINAREIGLADNVEYLDQLDEYGTIAWVHNLHATKTQMNTKSDGDKMGTFLKQRYPDDVLVIGTLFGTGTVQAWDYSGPQRKLNVFEVEAPPVGTLEGLFMEAGCGICLLDLRAIPEEGAVRDWFATNQQFRSIGNYYDSTQPNDFFIKGIIPDHFDMIIFIRETTRAQPTPFVQQKYFDQD